MSLKIDLGLESKSHKVDNNVDPMDALLGYTAAREAMIRGEAEIATLNTAMATIERGEEFKQAIISQTGNTELAITTAQESLRRALIITGNDAIADQIVAGTESIDGITSANENMLKNMAEKAKEYAKKVWEWIRNLVNKAIDFVKGIFGKNGATYDELLDLLKKAEKDKRTNLEDDKFPEATAKTLAGKVPVVLMEDKDVDGSRMKEFLGKMKNVASVTVSSTVRINGNYTNNNVRTGNAAKTAIDDMNLLGAAISEKKVHFADNELKDLQPDVEDKLGEVDGAYVELVGLTPKKAIYAALVLKEGAYTAYNELDEISGDDAMTRVKSALGRIKSGIEFKTIEITPDDPKGDFERIIPIDYNDAKAVAEEMKKLGKKAESESSKLQKAIDKAAKAITDTYKNLNDDSKDAEYLFSLEDKVISGFYKAAASGYSATLIATARNELGDIIKESIRLYKKA